MSGARSTTQQELILVIHCQVDAGPPLFVMQNTFEVADYIFMGLLEKGPIDSVQYF